MSFYFYTPTLILKILGKTKKPLPPPLTIKKTRQSNVCPRTRKSIFVCLFSVYNTSLTRHEQVCYKFIMTLS